MNACCSRTAIRWLTVIYVLGGGHPGHWPRLPHPLRETIHSFTCRPWKGSPVELRTCLLAPTGETQGKVRLPEGILLHCACAKEK